MRVGIYARVSRESSSNDNQLLILREYCTKMGYDIYAEYVDIVSGGSSNRIEFNRMMVDASKRKYDMLLFYALDRFSRQGLRITIQHLQSLESYGVSYKSYSEQYIDSAGIFGDVIIALLATLAKQERIRLSERVHAGLARARQQGRIGGRPKLDDKTVDKIKIMKADGYSIVDISKKLKVSRSSVYQYL